MKYSLISSKTREANAHKRPSKENNIRIFNYPFFHGYGFNFFLYLNILEAKERKLKLAKILIPNHQYHYKHLRCHKLMQVHKKQILQLTTIFL